MNKRTADALALASLMALTGLFAWRFVDFGVLPFEDAAMLMRYADHIAHGQGIVWNIGEPPVDGATDFLFMVVVALVHRIGFSLEIAVRLITISSHFITVALIYFGMRKVQNAGIIPAFLSASYFAIGAGLFLSAAYFGTPFFALAIAVAWLLAQRLIFSDGGTLFGCVVFSLVCLTAGLIRPEGVMIGVFMLIAVGIVIPFRAFRQLAMVFGGIFLALGGTYFVWRWNYFGYPLPNPFYKKGGGLLHASALRTSIRAGLRLLYVFIPAFLLSVRCKSAFRMGVAFLVPIAGSIGMWVLLSDEMNFGARFQYPVLALGALSWFPLVRTLPDDLCLPKFASLARMQKLAVVLTAACVLGVVFTQEVRGSAATYERDGRYDIAVMLSEYADRGYTIATTEAGLLPLYSRWRAIDTWGLNDQWIAHNGVITQEYLEQREPDIIVFHGFFSPLHPPSSELSGSSWSRQVLRLQEYAESHNFTLAAVFGVSPEDTHYYYVRADLPESEEIVRRIRSTDYVWQGNGRQCENYADLVAPGHMPSSPEVTPADADTPRP